VRGTKLTTQQFIDKSIKKHKNMYDYSKVEYINTKIKIEIICKNHGTFFQRPNNHLRGSGCGKCSKERFKSNTKEFIMKSNIVHNFKYDYSETEYKSRHEKLKIICSMHGQFSQDAGHHLNGHGCYDCGYITVGLKRELDLEEVIERANKIHNYLYDYSDSEYKGALLPMKIKCELHGFFNQQVSVHLNGHGCPTCKSSKGELKIRNFLKENCINFEEEKRFKKCRNKYTLSFDFYLPNHNLCIEFQGKQHYEPIGFFGGSKALKFQQSNDFIKRKYCKDNNIKLLEISYKEFENVNKILEGFLNVS